MSSIHGYTSTIFSWAQVVEERFQMKPEERLSLPIFDIVQQFQKEVKSSQDVQLNMADLAQKIKILSQEKLKYYDSSLFGFIKKWFSRLRNLYTIGNFKSSAEWGLQLSKEYLKKIKQSQIPDQANHLISQEPSEQREEVKDISIAKDVIIHRSDDDEESDDSTIYYDIIDEDVVIVHSDDDEESDDSTIYYDVINNEEEFFNDELTQEDQKKIDNEKTGNESEDADKLQQLRKKQTQEIVKENTTIKLPKDEMISTFHTIWQHASEEERELIANIWQTMTKEAEVMTWKSKVNSKDYQIELKKEISGSHSQIPIGKLVLKKKMMIAFSEEKLSNSNQYVKILSFPDKGLCHRVGIGWLAKDVAVQRILIREDAQGNIMCTVEAMGQNLEMSAEKALAFWKGAQWHKMS